MKNHHADELSHQKWRLGLCRDSGSTRPPPRRSKPTASRRPATGITRAESNGQPDHREDFEYVQWQNARKREEGAGETGKQRVIIKSQVQPSRRFAPEHPEQNRARKEYP